MKDYNPREGTPAFVEKSLEEKKEQLLQLINMVGVDVFVEEHVKNVNHDIIVDPDTFVPVLHGKIEFQWDIETAQDVHAIKGEKGEKDETAEYNQAGPKC